MEIEYVKEHSMTFDAMSDFLGTLDQQIHEQNRKRALLCENMHKKLPSITKLRYVRKVYPQEIKDQAFMLAKSLGV